MNLLRRRNVFIIAVQLLVVVILFTSCAESNVYNSLSLTDITLSTDVDKQLNPVNNTTVFTTEPLAIYCSFQNNKVPIGANITAKWIYVGGEVKELTNFVIDQWTETVKKNGRMAMFFRKPTAGRPKGNYKVVLSVNGVEEIVIPFAIK
jgi:hypothetical protein